MSIPLDDDIARVDGGEARGRATPLVRIRPGTSISWGDVGELWSYRELLSILMFRDIRVRYKQTAFGVLWAALKPLLTVFVFTLLFGWLARFPSEGLPYPIFAMAGLLSWSYFSLALGQCTSTFVDESHLVGKVYFPRLILPLAATLTPLVDLAVTTGVLLVLMAGYGVAPTYRLLALPLVLLQAILTVLAFGLWLAAANARYRDVGHALPFVLQIWMYASPVVYPVDVIPVPWRPLYALNPMVGIIDGFRWCLLGTPWGGLRQVAPSVVTVIAILAAGVVFFKKSEKNLVDML